ncbi:M28 family peptidase [Winogradskyella sp. 3972H.M.0a.05]|uniref:M28 family peptidase n=1 Tax=Winogradskyella sp. 3972H.M.0a.05 TaxID=2950277 RepID=UPI00339AB061
MKFYFLSALFLVGSCTELRYSEKVKNLKQSIVFEQQDTIEKYANTITVDELEFHIQKFASEEFTGRKTGEEGHNKACNYLRNFYQQHNIGSPISDNEYYQTVPSEYFPEGYNDSQNVIAYIEGEVYPEEVVIISGHSDHEGIVNGEIYLGADDNGSGTSAILEMAQAFKLAEQNGFRPKRSIAFMHMTAEEIGLYGSRYYTENPVFPLVNTVAALNLDMIGRTDRRHENDDEYIYIIGADRISTELHYVSEKANELFTNLELDYTYSADDDLNRYYYRSDHYNFALQGVPVIFYFNGEHEDYSKPTDTPDKINYDLLAKRTKLIFTTAWYLANSELRLSPEKL